MEIYNSNNPKYPYKIPNSYCYHCSTFQTICAYCIFQGYKTFLQIDCTGHNGLPIHLQSQTYKYDETGKIDKTYCCHCYFCFWQSPTIKDISKAVKLAEYAILKNK